MDSLTHIAAGAITPFMFKKAPRVWPVVIFGVLMGSLPDIDVVAGMSAQAMFIIHRSITHSLGVLLPAAILCAFLFKFLLNHLSYSKTTVRIVNGQAVVNRPGDWSLAEIFMTALIGLCGHVFLDCMTTFGTQIFWPVSDYRVAVPALYIVDPFFTLPLLACMLFCLLSFKNPARHDAQCKWAKRAFCFMLLYPLCCLGLQQGLSWELNQRYTGEGMRLENIKLSPALMSPITWKAVGETETDYYLARVSILDIIKKNEPVFYLGKHPTRKLPQKIWNTIENELPIFGNFHKFVSFPVYTVELQTDGTEIMTVQDLRYAPVNKDDYLHIFNSGDGFFLMQLRIQPDGNTKPWSSVGGKALAWRYLQRGKDAPDADGWVELEVPFQLP